MERVREPLKPAPEPKYAKSLSLDKAIESVLDLRADRHRVRSSPRPSTEAKEAAAQYVNRLADTGMPDVGPCLDHGEDPRWPTRFERVEEPEGLAQSRSLSEYRSYSVSTVALLPTLAWLHRDALIERLHQEIDMCATDEDALSLPEREKREAELAAAILDAERTVAAIAWQAETPWLIPHDIDPRAVLGVTGPEPRG